jgi:hypothetical protein
LVTAKVSGSPRMYIILILQRAPCSDFGEDLVADQ